MQFIIRVFCLIIVASSVIAESPKETILPVSEVSDTAPPVRISGTITAKDQPSEMLRYTFKTDITITNESEKPILLMILNLKVIPAFNISLDYSEEDDYFFQSKILQPSSNAKLEKTSGPFSEPQGPNEPHAPNEPRSFESSATAKVAYVQFLDGSAWGDAATAKRLLHDRLLSLDRLNILAKTYRDQGEQTFLKELLQPTMLQPVLALQQHYREKKDLMSVLAKLNEMLQNARVHAHDSENRRSTEHGNSGMASQ